ncbi:triose-phosphate isomerase [Neisseriaceae bacterium TC5R-5]|nr:triose-phosphate isomerase [Neisseriaceae bacterium TC5R-5]
MPAKLVIGNWKMNTRSQSAEALLAALLRDASTNNDQVAIAAPAVYLQRLFAQLQDGAIRLAAQDVSRYAADGAYTGELSAEMLADCGCTYVLVGHSERRQYFAETDAALLSKVCNVMAAGMVPVFCVGETLAQREQGGYLEVIHQQLALLTDIPEGGCVVAYEPVWAIGTGKVASLDQVAEIHDAIKIWCLQNVNASANIRVLYGGSVKADNAAPILATKNVDGVLVGGASLDAEIFKVICQAAGISI